jgi:DNA-binding XRE family transcriptional regulator
MSTSAQLATLAFIAMFDDMLKRDRERAGMSELQAARRFRVSSATYRRVEAGEEFPSSAIYESIVGMFGWPCAYVAPGGRVRYRKGSAPFLSLSGVYPHLIRDCEAVLAVVDDSHFVALIRVTPRDG